MNTPPDRSGSDNGQDTGGFLARWSRRKSAARQGQVPAEPAPAATPAARPAVVARPPAPVGTMSAPTPPLPAAPAARAAGGSAAPARPGAATELPPPTLADVARLDARTGDFSRFVARQVDNEVRNAALKKLFSDPHFNVMDGLDIYIDDYSQPDPLPPGMLEQLRQTDLLGLKTPEPDAEPDSEPVAATESATATAAATPGTAAPPDQPEPATIAATASDAEPRWSSHAGDDSSSASASSSFSSGSDD